MPRTSEAHMVRNRATGMLPPEKAITAPANLSPVPVMFRTPMMSPAVAQAEISPTACFAPSAMPATALLTVMRVSRRRNVHSTVA